MGRAPRYQEKIACRFFKVGICYNPGMNTSWRFWVIICFVLLYHPVEGVAQEQEILHGVSKLPLAGASALRGGEEKRLFKPSQMISVELSKKELKKIYWDGGHNRTFHCGCFFDKIQQLAPQICAHGAKGGNRVRDRKFLGWVHVVPAAAFAKPLKCWNEALCRRGRKSGDNGARCCNVLSQRFKKREADMHNLFPAIGRSDAEQMGSSPMFGGLEEYRFCSVESKPVMSPRPGARGDIARAYFYMSRQYKFAIAQDLEDRLRTWHLEDPPDKWEEERNILIEMVQGNRNPFIDHPELVERVKDF
ncbi:MAG: endonuclease [Nitrospinae bacterium]|nr:endonuclease [Nitrospinota bacterium]